MPKKIPKNASQILDLNEDKPNKETIAAMVETENIINNPNTTKLYNVEEALQELKL
jgi:hypothetical protein